MPKEREPQHWWQTIPGSLTAVGGVITAITALMVALNQAGFFTEKSPAASKTEATKTEATKTETTKTETPETQATKTALLPAPPPRSPECRSTGGIAIRWRVWAVGQDATQGEKSAWCQLAFSG